MKKVLLVLKNIAKKVFAYLKQAKIEWLIIVGAVALDLISKAIIQSTMKVGESIVIIPNFLEFYFTYNKAAAFSFDFGLSKILGQEGVMTVFIIITFLALILFGFVLYRLRNRRLIARVAFALIIGGAIGNLYDRIAFSMVRDFIRIVYFGLNIPFLGGTGFAIFNFADAFLVIGVFVYIFYVLFMETKDVARLEKSSEKEQNIDNVLEETQPNGEEL